MSGFTRFALFAAHTWVKAAVKLAELDDDQLVYEPLLAVEELLASMREDL